MHEELQTSLASFGAPSPFRPPTGVTGSLWQGVRTATAHVASLGICSHTQCVCGARGPKAGVFQGILETRATRYQPVPTKLKREFDEGVFFLELLSRGYRTSSPWRGLAKTNSFLSIMTNKGSRRTLFERRGPIMSSMSADVRKRKVPNLDA